MLLRCATRLDPRVCGHRRLQEAHDIVVALLRRRRQRRHTILRDAASASAASAQHAAAHPLMRCTGALPATHRCRDVLVGAAHRPQHPESIRETGAHSGVQRGVAVLSAPQDAVLARVRHSPAASSLAHTRPVREARLLLHIHISAVLHQDTHDLGIPVVCGSHQRRPTVLRARESSGARSASERRA
jgi:hypothetical protein